MIDSLKNLTKKKIAGLLLIIIIIIAFGFGGFGGGFNSGNQNNIVKINNKNITTQDFIEYLNRSGLSQQVIKNNIDEDILEELLSTLVSTKLISFEIKDLKLEISEEMIRKKLLMNKNLQNENGVFQRTLYEKFLLSNNLSAPMYEIKLKNNFLQKQLFTYISGGAKSPDFLVKKYYKEKNSKLEIDFIDLNNFYKQIDEFTNDEIQFFINENADKLKQDFIDFTYTIITPKNLTGLDDFDQVFFDKIDDIENKIAKNIDYKSIVAELNLTPTVVKDFINLENKKTIENTIYNSRNDKIEILEDGGTYIFYQIDKVNTKLPDINDIEFNLQIKNLLFQKEKFEYNKKILDKINNNNFNQASFDNFGAENIKRIKLNSIMDNKKFEINSVKILYSLPIDNFTLIADDNDNVYIAKSVKYEQNDIAKSSDKFNAISNETSAENRNGILKSYDYLLNSKYKVIINQKALNRIKNSFR